MENRETHPREFIVVGLGEILWDMLPDGKKLGGAPANFAYHAQALGEHGIVVSCVGKDNLGKEILDSLDSLGLDRQFVAVDDEHPTGTVTVELDEDGKPNYTIHENAAWDFIPFDSNLYDFAGKIDAVCFGSLCQRSDISHKTICSFLNATKSDCIKVFDINFRQSFYNREIVSTMLELSNVLKLNDEELPVLADILTINGSESDILSHLAERYQLRLIALTRGANGSLLYTRNESSSHQGLPARIADTVGAGDSFTAALTLGLLRGYSLERINEHANKVASFVCSQDGATPILPDSLVEEYL